MKRFNEWLAIQITKYVGTMYTFYLFNVLAFLSVKSAFETHNLVPIVNWISSNWIQLVLLPAIMVGQNIQAKKHAEIHSDVKAIHDHLGISKGGK